MHAQGRWCNSASVQETPTRSPFIWDSLDHYNNSPFLLMSNFSKLVRVEMAAGNNVISLSLAVRILRPWQWNSSYRTEIKYKINKTGSKSMVINHTTLQTMARKLLKWYLVSCSNDTFFICKNRRSRKNQSGFRSQEGLLIQISTLSHRRGNWSIM